MAILRSLLVNMGLNSSQYRTELTKTQKQTKTSYADMAKSAGKFGAASAAALTAAVKASADMVRTQDNMARLAQMSINEYNAMSFAATQYGLSAEKITSISKDTSEKIGEYINSKSGGLQDFADAMGMSEDATLKWAKSVQGMAGIDILEKMIGEMEGAGLSVEQMSHALEGMGSEATNLIPLLSNNSAEMDRLVGKYSQFNLEMSPEKIKQYREAAENIDLMTSKLKLMATNGLSVVLDEINDVSMAWGYLVGKFGSAEFDQNSLKGLNNQLEELESTKRYIEQNIAARRGSVFYSDKDAAENNANLKSTESEIEKIKNQIHEIKYGGKPIIDISNNVTVTGKVKKPAKDHSFQDEADKQARDLAKSLILQNETYDEAYRRKSEILKQGNLDQEEYLKAQTVLDKEYAEAVLENKKTWGEIYGPLDQVDMYALNISKQTDAEARALADSLKLSTETLEEKYSRESAILEQGLSDHQEYLEAKKMLDDEYATAQREATEKAAQFQYQNSMDLLSYTSDMFGITTNMLESAGKEQTAVYKALFLAQKAAAIPSMIVATEEAATKALTMGPVAGPILAASTKALGYASIGVVAGQAIAGVAHGGIDEIPGYGKDQTWLLQGGERVVSKEQNQDLKNYIKNGNQPVAGGNVTIQVMGNIYGDEQTEKIMSDAAQRGYKMMYDDARSNGPVSNQIRR